MKLSRHRSHLTRLLVFALSCCLSFSTFQVASEDIDIFSVDVDETVNKPNVIIVLDNSANWSRQSQQWPGRATQGQSEVRAIRDVIIGAPDDPLTPTINEFAPGLPDNSINVGVMEHITGGTSTENDSAIVRMHIVPMSAANKNVLKGHMDTIYDNINAPEEKRNSGNPFGNLFWDVYNYLAGTTASQNGAGTLDSKSDDSGYSSKHDIFRSPLTETDVCTRTVVIFIGNNVSTGPTGDSAANVAALTTLGGNTAQIPFANYDIKTIPQSIDAGYTSAACYTNDGPGLSACTSAEAGSASCISGGFNNCLCNAASTTACPTLGKYAIHGQQVSSTVAGPPTSSSQANRATGEATKCQNNSPGGYTCPASSSSNANGPGPSQFTTTTISWSGCSYVAQANACGNNNNKDLWTPRGTKTTTTQVYDRTLSPLGPVSPAATSTCRIDAANCTALDFPASCSNGTYENCQCAGTPNNAACGSPPPGAVKYGVIGNLTATVEAVANGTFSTPGTQGGKNYMADEWARFLREKGVPLPGGTGGKAQVTTYTIDAFNAQQNTEFSALLFNMARVGGGKYFQAKNENQLRDALLQIFSEVQAVNSAFSSASLPVNATNRAQNENQIFIGLFRPDRTKKPRWFGNLKRYQAISSGPSVSLGDSQDPPNLAINPLTGFLADCAVSFWTTQSGNYWSTVTTDDPPAVGNCGAVPNSADSDLPDGPFVEKGAVAEMIRKGNDPAATPNSFGNYVVNRTIKTRSGTTLVDFTSANLPNAIDWDGDGDVGDADDISRKPLVANFTRGEDRLDEDLDAAADTTNTPSSGLTEPRSTIHGDVIHSRPQPVNYGDADGNDANGIFPGVVVYYGANDGTFRAVRAETGQELWSFVAPEHYSKLARLVNNVPNIRYFPDAVGQKKDYFFDGSTGLFQNADDSKIYIFPTMRRGGRKIYAFDVTSKTAPMLPTLLWSKGCDPAGVCDNDADGNFSAMGQTWSIPAPGFIKGVSSGTQPIVVFGGGYDACEDGNTAKPACGAATGRGVYVVNADTGVLIRYFDFSGFTGARSVAADVALLDINSDGKADYAYAVDTGGSVYRLKFLKADGTPETDPTQWSVTRVARTGQVIAPGDEDLANDNDPRKFLFTPALFQAGQNVIYVAIGSGDREAPLITQYPYDDRTGNGTGDGGVTNRFYVFKDDLTGGTAEIDLDFVDAANMVDYTTEASPCCNAPVTPGDPNDAAAYAAAPKGWFINLNAQGQGEQVVTSAVIVAGFVIFSTNRPTATSTTACESSLGEARGYFVNLFNGSGAIGVEGSQGGDRSSVFVGGGLPPSPVVAVIPIGDRLVTVVIGAAQKDGSPSSSIELQPPPIPIRTRRTPVYWFKSLDTD